MQPRHIDGIYAREPSRRSDPKRRILVPPRLTDSPDPSPTTATVVPIVDVMRTPVFTPLSPEAPLLQPNTPPLSQPIATQTPTPTPTPAPAQTPTPTPTPAPTPQPRPASATHSRPKYRRLSTALYVSLIVVVLGVTAALAYSTWRTNEEARTAFAQEASTAQTSNSSSAVTEDTPPSEAEVTEAAKQSYTVAADMPRMIHIDRIGIHARILRMSVTASGAIQAPASIWDAGWYDGSAKPGEAGMSFIDGHISGPTMPAVFEKLHTLHAGDFVTIERGDRSTVTYVVKTISTNKVEDIDMKQVLATPKNGVQQLTLMTCGGNYQGNFTYDSRVIVVAEKV